MSLLDDVFKYLENNPSDALILKQDDLRRELEQDLLSHDPVARNTAVDVALKLSRKGNDVPLLALESIIRHKHGQKDCKFYTPSSGRVNWDMADFESDKIKLLNLADNHQLWIVEPREVQELISHCFMLGRGLSLNVVQDLLKSIAERGGDEQAMAFQLLATHLQATADLRKARMPGQGNKSNDYKFNGIYLLYDCPFCGKPQDKAGFGQSIIWIASECIDKGFAVSCCSNCGKAFKMSASIFKENILEEIRRVSRLSDDQLYSYIITEFVNPGLQHTMLDLDWQNLLRKANASGPFNTMEAEWREGKVCPNCGTGPNSSPIGFTYACPSCNAEISVAQQDINKECGVQVVCGHCTKKIFIPASVWCQKCKRALVSYYEILRRISNENKITVEQIDPSLKRN